MAGGAGKTKNATALTHRTIDALKPEQNPYRVPDVRCVGLALRVATSGKKTWDFSYRVKDGGPKRVSLGRFPEVSLEAARERANQVRAAAHSGRNLVWEEAKARRYESQKITVAELIEIYEKRRLAGRLRTAKEIKHRLVRTLAPYSKYGAHLLEKRNLRELFDQTADAGTIREAEARRQTVSTMFKWAFAQDLIPHNPTDGLTSYQSNSTRDRVLSVTEVARLWSWLEAPGNWNESYADVLRVQLALGARCTEVAGIIADEIDQDRWIWILPAERSKNKKPRQTPLVGSARDILVRRLSISNGGPLFSSGLGKPLDATCVASLLYKQRKLFPIDHFTTHDLRRTVATMMVELGVHIDVVAAVIGHETGSSNSRTLLRHYVHTDRIEQKRDALSIWDQRLLEIVRGAQVVQLSGKQA